MNFESPVGLCQRKKAWFLILMGLTWDLGAELKSQQFWAFKERNVNLEVDAHGEIGHFQD